MMMYVYHCTRKSNTVASTQIVIFYAALIARVID
jgi:hypothetical protein